MEMTTTKMLQANFRRGVFHRVRWNTILVEDAQRILEQRHGRVSTEIRLYTCTYENEETAVALMQLLSMHATKVVINAAKGWKDSFESLNPGHLQVLDLYGVSELALFKSFESMQSLVKIPTQQLCLTFWSYVEPDLSAQLFAALKSGMQNPGENAKDVCLFHFYHSQKVEMVQQVCDADVFTQVSLDKTSLDACLSSLPLLVRHCRRLRKISCYPDGAIKNSERAQLKSSIGNDLESNGTLEHFEFGHNDWEDAKVQSYLRRNVALQKATEFVAEEHTQTEWIDFLSSFTLQENDGEALSAIYLVLRCTLADVLA